MPLPTVQRNFNFNVKVHWDRYEYPPDELFIRDLARITRYGIEHEIEHVEDACVDLLCTSMPVSR